MALEDLQWIKLEKKFTKNLVMQCTKLVDFKNSLKNRKRVNKHIF